MANCISLGEVSELVIRPKVVGVSENAMLGAANEFELKTLKASARSVRRCLSDHGMEIFLESPISIDQKPGLRKIFL